MIIVLPAVILKSWVNASKQGIPGLECISCWSWGSTTFNSRGNLFAKCFISPVKWIISRLVKKVVQMFWLVPNNCFLAMCLSMHVRGICYTWSSWYRWSLFCLKCAKHIFILSIHMPEIWVFCWYSVTGDDEQGRYGPNWANGLSILLWNRLSSLLFFLHNTKHCLYALKGLTIQACEFF